MAHMSKARCRFLSVVTVLTSLPTLSGCGGVDRPDGWVEATHGKDTSPNYDLLFTTSEVHSIDIVIKPSDFQAAQDDLASLFSGGGNQPGGNIPGGGMPGGGDFPAEMTAACVGLAENAACEVTVPQKMQGACQPRNGTLVCMPQGVAPGGDAPDGGGPPGGGGAVNMLAHEPIYIPVEVHHDGHTWWSVGMRYKGNSSLSSTYRAGNGKLPFRLNFDKYESEHHEIDDQRFYGFKDLTFASNWSDDSQIREAFASELLRDRGVPAARCAFYRVSVDVGNGPEYWGLYTAIEDPSDKAMLDSQLRSHDGNLYKPEGTGADWTVFDQAGFVKKNNEDAADWSDVQAAIAALLADQSDASAWRAGLESTFDVDGFLRWLAVNTAMKNWDSYGSIAHNYYLYGDPALDGRLRWIPWDHNLSMMAQGDVMAGGSREGDGGGVGPGGVEVDATTEILHTDAGSNWPLISRTLNDPTYRQRYRHLLSEALGGLFDVEHAAARMRELHSLIESHVVGENGENASHTTISSAEAFQQSVDGEKGLVANIANRHARVVEALAAQ